MLHLSALSLSSRQSTDGKLPRRAVRRLWPCDDVDTAVKALEDCGLWKRPRRAGELTTWNDHLLSAAEVDRRRKANAEARSGTAAIRSATTRCASAALPLRLVTHHVMRHVTSLYPLRLDSTRNVVRERGEEESVVRCGVRWRSRPPVRRRGYGPARALRCHASPPGRVRAGRPRPLLGLRPARVGKRLALWLRSQDRRRSTRPTWRCSATSVPPPIPRTSRKIRTATLRSSTRCGRRWSGGRTGIRRSRGCRMRDLRWAEVRSRARRPRAAERGRVGTSRRRHVRGAAGARADEQVMSNWPRHKHRARYRRSARLAEMRRRRRLRRHAVSQRDRPTQ